MMQFPCWRKRRPSFPGVTILRTPAEIASAHLTADIELQREHARQALEALAEEAAAAPKLTPDEREEHVLTHWERTLELLAR